MRQIQHIKFPALKTVYLLRSKIESVESLQRLEMPHLEFLSLSSTSNDAVENNISCVRVFAKVHLPALTELHLSTWA